MRYTLLLLFLPITISAQTISGRITDAVTGEILPFASVAVSGSTKGTTANAEGVFSLVVFGQRVSDVTLQVSYVGYETRQLAAGGGIIIALRPLDKMLSEVIIMPDSALRMLLKRAYARIEKNYITQPFSMTCFYREALKTTYDRYIYTGEALTHAYSTGYQNSEEDGQVQLLKTRVSRFGETDTLTNTHYFGGPFVNKWDYVKKRADFLKADFSHYTYTLIEETRYDDRPTYIITFARKTKNPATQRTGRLVIDKQTLGYRQIEVTVNGDSTASRYEPGQENKFRVSYQLQHGRWHLQQASGYKRSPKGRKPVIVSTNLLVTAVETVGVQPIPYDQRFGYGDIFSFQESNYIDSFWNDYTTIVPEASLFKSMTEAQRSILGAAMPTIKSPSTASRQQSTTTKITKFLSHLERRIGIRYDPVQASRLPSKYQLNYPSAGVRFAQSSPIETIPIYLTYTLGYTTSRWSALYTAYGYFGSRNVQASGAQFIGSYRLLARKRGNPLFLKPTIGIFGQSDYRTVGWLDNPEHTIAIDRKDFRTDRVNLLLGTQQQGLLLGLQAEQKMKGTKWIYVDIGWRAPLSDTWRIRGQEDRFFLFRRDKSEPLTESSTFRLIEVQLPSPPRFNIYTEAGIRWALR